MLKITTLIKNKVTSQNIILQDDDLKPVNLIYIPEYNNDSINFLNKLKKKSIIDYIIFPINFPFMTKRINSNEIIKKIKTNIPTLKIQRKFLKNSKHTSIFNLSALSENLVALLKSRSVKTTMDNLIILLNGIKYDAPEDKKIYLIIDGNNQEDKELVNALRYYVSINGWSFPNLKLDGIILYGNDKYWPITFSDDENELKVNPTMLLKYFKEVHSIDLDIKEESKEDQLKKSKEKILDIYNQISSSEKNASNEFSDIKSLKSDELQENPIEIIKYELNTNKFIKGKTVEEKINYLFNNTKEKPQEKISEVDTKKLEKINNELLKLNKLYNGTIEFNGKTLQKESNTFFDISNIIKINRVNGYNKQSTEFENNLDSSMFDLIKALEEDKNLGIKILNIKTEIKNLHHSIYKSYKIKLQHPKHGYEKPYTIEFQVPYLNQGKYIKIGGNNYILSNQFFPKPVLKVNPNMVRVYTHYSTVAITLKSNIIDKFNSFNDLLTQFENELNIKKMLKKTYKLSDEEKEYLFNNYLIPKNINNEIFTNFDIKSGDINIKIDFLNEKDGKIQFYERYENNRLIEYAKIDPNNEDIIFITKMGDKNKWGKDRLSEFLLNILNNISEELLKSRVDIRSKNSKPYFGLRISNKEIALIHIFILRMGLLDTLKFLNIKYQIGIRQPDAVLNLKLKTKQDGKYEYLSIFANTIEEYYLVSGLRQGAKQIFPVSKNELNSKELYDPFFLLKGYNYAKKTRESTNHFIDVTTKHILKQYNMPTDIDNLFGKYIPKLLLNGNLQDISDLNNQRLRMVEVITHATYDMFSKAIGHFRNAKDSKNAYSNKIRLYDTITKELLDKSDMLQYTQATNPLEELLLSTKTTKTGIGNMKKDQVTLEKRDLNKSYFGVIAASTTNEYANIGQNQSLVNGSTITDRFGTIMTKEFDNNHTPFDNLSVAESLTPFYEYDDSTRRVMGNQQFGQFVQLNHPDEPLIQTGFESVIPKLVSDRFAIKSHDNGRVVKIDTKFIYIKLKDNSIVKYNIKESKSRTKRGVYIPLKYNLLVKEGQIVYPNQTLAATNSLKTGKLAPGKNLVTCIMSYRGMNYEDGWAVSETITEKFNNPMYEKISIIVPLGANVNQYNILLGKNTNPGDLLIEYSSINKENISKYLDVNTNTASEKEVDSVSVGLQFEGDKVIYRSPGGIIKDIVIKLNSKDIDKSIKAAYDKQSKEIKEEIEECELVKFNNKKYVNCLSNVDNSETLIIGNHKLKGNEFDGALIDIFIEKKSEISHGSKFTLGNSGGKGTIQYIIPKGMEPIGKSSGLKIEFIPTPVSFFSRKNISNLLNLYTGKVSYFMNKKIFELAGSGKIPEIKKLLVSVYLNLDMTKDKRILKEIDEFFKASTPEILKYIKNSDPLSRPAFPIIIPPFSNHLTSNNIHEAAKVLNIELDEYVYIKEEDFTTLNKVPVGINHILYLEHFPKIMSSSRGSVNVTYQFSTGQGRSGTTEGNGAIKMGLYDLFSLSIYTPDQILKEVHGIKSDNKDARNKFNRKIIKSGGEMPYIEDMEIDSKVQARTKKLIDAYFRGAIIEPNF